MNLFRLLLLAAAAYVFWRLLKISSRAPLPPAQDEPHYEAMARCAGCGTYLPARSLSRSGRCGRCSG
ncbi:hypothetical protein [Solimonas soli]|uniref:hypothetical protein n=1 Tax=Solimonas soli TaxID=413479 RepID=UPI0004ACC1CB|nr:hypothetical protein [Solimonas soli]